MGGHSCYEGGHRAHRGPPPVPPQLKKTLKPEIISVNFNKNYWFEKYRIDTSSPFVLQKILLLIEFTLGHLLI